MSQDKPSRRSPKPSRISRRSSRDDVAVQRLPSERLTARHETSDFSCGQSELDEWLRSSAFHAQKSGTGRTWVWTSAEREVIAYYTLAPHIVRRLDVPKRVGRGSPDVIPSILIARLALDESLQGRRLGRALLADALTRVLHGIEIVGGRLVVVDAIDERAATFYEHHDFVRTPSDTERLVIKASDVTASIPGMDRE